MPAKRKPPSPHAKAERHLRKSHDGLRKVIERVGPCTLQVNSNHFHVLARTIISQQLSGKAADSIRARLVQALAPDGLVPARIQTTPDETIRCCGLSGGKLKALRDLSAKVLDGSLPLDGLAEMTDQEVTESLLQVHGIGPWSVDMFLMFSLGRPDVLPIGDLGLRVGMKELFGLKQIPPPKTLVKLAQPWRPYRSVATWYLWRSRGPVPQS
jgi:DNA-3-methyladenine glycosylase II